MSKYEGNVSLKMCGYHLFSSVLKYDVLIRDKFFLRAILRDVHFLDSKMNLQKSNSTLKRVR